MTSKMKTPEEWYAELSYRMNTESYREKYGEDGIMLGLIGEIQAEGRRAGMEVAAMVSCYACRKGVPTFIHLGTVCHRIDDNVIHCAGASIRALIDAPSEVEGEEPEPDPLGRTSGECKLERDPNIEGPFMGEL